MTDQNTAAYRLVPTGLIQTTVLSPTLKPGERRKVNVKNTAAPFDEMVVDGWITKEAGEKLFHFEDGQLGR
jgi:hypothetical protein